MAKEEIQGDLHNQIAYAQALARVSEAIDQQLRELKLVQIGLKHLPPSIGRCTSLRALYLSANELETLPPEIGFLQDLEVLDLSDNPLSALPRSIQMLRSLRDLRLRNTRLKRLPGEIGNLRALRLLELTGSNRIDLPLSFGKLARLQLLGIDPRQLPALERFLRGTGQGAAAAIVVDHFAKLAAETANPRKPKSSNAPALEQRPASFRFALRDGKIDVAPLSAMASNADFARITQAELLAKAEDLSRSLEKSNSARRVQASIDRLIAALRLDFAQLNPGILLSRKRTIEADQKAFDSAEGRSELFPEAIAQMIDVLASLEDLLGSFPEVRDVEHESAALKIQQNPEVLRDIEAHSEEIKKAAAAAADLVTPATVAALHEHDAEIADAPTLKAKAGLIADQLIVQRNFVSLGVQVAVAAERSEASEEVVGLVRDSWKALRDGLPDGIRAMAKILPTAVCMTLLVAIAGPVAGLAALTPGFNSLATAIARLQKSRREERGEPTSKQSKPRRAKKRAEGKSRSWQRVTIPDDANTVAREKYRHLQNRVVALLMVAGYPAAAMYRSLDGNTLFFTPAAAELAAPLLKEFSAEECEPQGTHELIALTNSN